MNRPARRAYVSIDTGVDPAAYERAYRRDEVPDRLPYGLAHLRDHGFELAFLPPRRTGLLTRAVAEAGRRASDDLNVWSVAEGARRRRGSDVVLAWEERVGLPVALGRRVGEPPCVTGVIWLTDRSRALSRAHRALMRRALGQAAGVFVLSTAQVAPLVEEWGVDESRAHYVPFGVPVEQWVRGGEEPDPLLAVSAGNDWDRDHRLTIAAAGEVRRRGVPLRLELLTAREVPGIEPWVLKRQAAGVADSRATYGRAGFVVVSTRPNLHVSGVTVALEAMACGRAVIITSTPGMEDYVVDGETGFLVPPGDAGTLADRMATLACDPELAARMGAAGRERAGSRFTSEQTAARLAGILRNVTD